MIRALRNHKNKTCHAEIYGANKKGKGIALEVQKQSKKTKTPCCCVILNKPFA